MATRVQEKAPSKADLWRELGTQLRIDSIRCTPAAGSGGRGLAVGVGDALAAQRLDRLPYRVWVLLGDSEMAEGSVWEAFHLAAYYQLHNLVAIVDVNRLGQRGETELGWNTGAYA